MTTAYASTAIWHALLAPESGSKGKVLPANIITPDIGEKQNEHNVHNFDQLETYTIRDPGYSNLSRTHPRADEISRLSSEWMRKHNLQSAFDEKSFAMFQVADPARAMSRVYPDSPFAGTLWMCKLVLLLFLADDILESRPGQLAPGTASYLLIEWNLVLIWSFPKDSDDLISNLLSLFDDEPEYRKQLKEVCDELVAGAAQQPFGTPYPEELLPCASGFHDLWQEAIAVMPKKWAVRAALSFHTYFAYHIQERFYCKENKIPTIEEYALHRIGTGGMELCLGVGADMVCKNVDVAPDDVYDSPQVTYMLHSASLGASLVNDIYSFPKELRNGEYFNMVFLVSYWQQCSYNEASEIVVKMTEDINRDIIATCEEIKRTSSPELQRALEPTLQACANVMPATHMFCTSSSRYGNNIPLLNLVHDS